MVKVETGKGHTVPTVPTVGVPTVGVPTVRGYRMITVLSPKIRSRLAGRRYPSSLVGIRTRCPRCREIAPDQQGYFRGRGPTRICTPCLQELLDATDDERRSWNLPPLKEPSRDERYALHLIERGLRARGIEDGRRYF